MALMLTVSLDRPYTFGLEYDVAKEAVRLAKLTDLRVRLLIDTQNSAIVASEDDVQHVSEMLKRLFEGSRCASSEK